MKQSTILSLTALALVVATPELAKAKAPSHVTFVPKTTSHLVKAGPATIDKTTTGTIDTTSNGQGTYTRTVTGTAANQIVTTTDDFANGKDYTYTADVIKGSNGTITRDMTSDLPNGQVTTRDEVETSTGTAGDYNITGFQTLQNGKVDQFSGTQDATKYGSDTVLTVVSYNDKTETLNDQTLKAGNATASVTTGIGFNGNAIDNATLTVSNTIPASNAVTTTVDGQGTYYRNVTNDPGISIVNSERNFADGTSTTTVSTNTINANGSTTNDSSSTYVPASGQDTSAQSILTYTNQASGPVAVTGSYNQSNGYYGTVSGTKVATVSGSNTDLTYTNQNGATKTADTQTLTAGNTTLNINTGTTFTGQANDSIGLIASATN